MATDFRAFLVTFGLYAAVCVLVFLFFGLFRRSKVAYKFYNPARFDEPRYKRRPKPLPPSLLGWVGEMYRYGQADIAAIAGHDAATFLRVFAFGAEFFAFLCVWCLVIILPINISAEQHKTGDKMVQGSQVAYLIGENAVPTSDFTYWVPPPPPPLPPGASPPQGMHPPDKIKAPNFYEANIPPAPAGLRWWKYRSGVPPLPEPADYFNDSSYASYGWKYDSSYVANDYIFSNLDLSSLSNISNGDRRLWAHLVSTWVISLYLWRLLWRYNRDAVALRIQFLTLQERSLESRTALVRDLPGVYYGTLPDRIERTALRFLPAWIKRRIVVWGSRGLQLAETGLDAGLTNFSQVVLPDVGGVTPPAHGTPSPARNSSTGISTAPGAEEQVGPGDAALGPIPFSLDAYRDAVLAGEAGCSMSKFVEQLFDRAFEGQVERIDLCYDTRELDRLARKFAAATTALQDLLDDYISTDRRGRRIKRQKVTAVGPSLGSWGLERYGTTPQRVDALRFYMEYLPVLLVEIKQAQEDCLPPDERTMPAAFVTFRQRVTQVTATSAMFHQDRTAWVTCQAPGPEEIIWKNLGWRKWERTVRFCLAWALFFVIVAFYIPFVSGIQALLRIDALLDLPGISSTPLLSTLASSFLPSLVLRLFLVVLPYALAALGRFQGFTCRSAVEFGVAKKLFTFQFLTVFLTSLVAGTLFSQAQQFLRNPSSLVASLGAAAPQTATFFMLYLLLTGLIAKPVQFLRIPGLVLVHVQTWLASTERAKARLWEDQYVDYGWEIPDASVTILLGLTYCLVQPLIVPIALLYFLVNSALYKYQLIYVHKPRFESGGFMWAQVFDHVMLSALAFQIVMLSLVGLKGGLVQSLLLLPLLALWVFLWTGAHDLFRRPLRQLSVHAASEMDRQKPGAGTAQHDDRAYMHPAFAISEDAVEPLLSEAQRVEEVLSTGDRAPGLLAAVVSEHNEDVEMGAPGRASGNDTVRTVLLADSRRSSAD